MMRVLLFITMAALPAFFFVSSCKKNKESEGCTSYSAVNYDPNATVDDGSCVYDTTTWPSPGPADFNVSLGTTWSDNWNDWNLSINGVAGTISTDWTDNWNDWSFSFGGVSGDISTTWSNNWNDWDITGTGFSLDLSTTWTDNWNDWDIDDNNSAWQADVSSTWNDNWNDFDVTGDSVNIDLGTTWTNDWDDWSGTGTFGTAHPVSYKIVIVFVPVIVSVLKQQGIIL